MPPYRHGIFEFIILFIWLTIRRQYDELPLLMRLRRLRWGTAMSAELQVRVSAAKPSRRRTLAGLLASAGFLAGCSSSSVFSNSSLFSSSPSSPQAANTPPAPAATIGTGQVKVGLILPMSAGGNAAIAAQAMRNAA